MLNEYLSAMAVIGERYGGAIDKFVMERSRAHRLADTIRPRLEAASRDVARVLDLRPKERTQYR